jgi:hypothetical protein
MANFFIILRASVPIFNHHGNRRPQRSALENPAHYPNSILLLPLGSYLTLARPPPIEFPLDPFGIQRQTRGAAIYNNTHCSTMAFTPGSNAKKSSERVSRHVFMSIMK